MDPTDLAAVAIFVKVVELQNFRAAARALKTPRSTVSARVAQLEERLGARLLERSTRAMRLTAAGAAFHAQVAPAVEAVAAAEHAVADLETAPSGELRVTVPIETGQQALGPVIAAYMQRYPEVKVHLELLDRQVDLVNESFDVAVRVGEMQDSALVVRKLTPPRLRLLHASPAYLRRFGTPRKPGDLRSHALLAMTGEKEPTSWAFDVDGKRVRIDFSPRASANSFVVLRDLAAAGVGIARLPRSLGAASVKDGRLQTVLDDFAEVGASWYAVFPSARQLSPRVRAFVDVLAEVFPPLITGPEVISATRHARRADRSFSRPRRRRAG